MAASASSQLPPIHPSAMTETSRSFHRPGVSDPSGVAAAAGSDAAATSYTSAAADTGAAPSLGSAPSTEAWLSSACAVLCALRGSSRLAATSASRQGPSVLNSPQPPHSARIQQPEGGAQAWPFHGSAEAEGGTQASAAHRHDDELLEAPGVSPHLMLQGAQGCSELGCRNTAFRGPATGAEAEGGQQGRGEMLQQKQRKQPVDRTTEREDSEGQANAVEGGGKGEAPHLLWQVSWKCRCRHSKGSTRGDTSGSNGNGAPAVSANWQPTLQQRSADGGNGSLGRAVRSPLDLSLGKGGLSSVLRLPHNGKAGGTSGTHGGSTSGERLRQVPCKQPVPRPCRLQGPSRLLSSHSGLPQLPQLPPELLPPPQNLQSLVDALNSGGVNVRIAVNGGVYNVQIPPLPAVGGAGPSTPPVNPAPAAGGARPPDSSGALGLKLSDLQLNSGR